MIEEQDYRLPKKQHKEKKLNPNSYETVKWLEEHMGFRPFTCEW